MSTTRYSNAGAPGTGTTIDNMASRAKAWLNLNTSGTFALRGALNIASVTDAGVGSHAPNFAAPMLAVNGYSLSYGHVFAATGVNKGQYINSLGTATYNVISYENAANIDLVMVTNIVHGDLA